jgi:hypothetical protein
MTDHVTGERRANDGWHLDKKVPISLIFAILGQAAMVIWAIADIKKDVELIKHDIDSLHARDTGIEAQTREYIRTINEQLTRVDTKLDRLIERSK